MFNCLAFLKTQDKKLSVPINYCPTLSELIEESKYTMLPAIYSSFEKAFEGLEISLRLERNSIIKNYYSASIHGANANQNVNLRRTYLQSNNPFYYIDAIVLELPVY